MKVIGDKNYKISQMGVYTLQKNDPLPCQLKCDAQLYKDVIIDLLPEL